MFSRWAYILIGNNSIGKTSFQRGLINELCSSNYKRLALNTVHDITHPSAPRKLKTIFTANRSYQEKAKEYKTVQNYFQRYFCDADICVLSSHTNGNSRQHIEQMFYELHSRCYNVAGIFWSNGFDANAKEITQLPWQERLWIENPKQRSKVKITAQLSGISREFSEMLINRSMGS